MSFNLVICKMYKESIVLDLWYLLVKDGGRGARL